MRKSTLAIAALVTTLSSAILIPSAYADDSATMPPTDQTTTAPTDQTTTAPTDQTTTAPADQTTTAPADQTVAPEPVPTPSNESAN